MEGACPGRFTLTAFRAKACPLGGPYVTIGRHPSGLGGRSSARTPKAFLDYFYLYTPPHAQFPLCALNLPARSSVRAVSPLNLAGKPPPLAFTTCFARRHVSRQHPLLHIVPPQSRIRLLPSCRPSSFSSILCLSR